MKITLEDIIVAIKKVFHVFIIIKQGQVKIQDHIAEKEMNSKCAMIMKEMVMRISLKENKVINMKKKNQMKWENMKKVMCHKKMKII